jgi:hypothetical protein
MPSSISRISRVLLLAVFANSSIPDEIFLTWHLLEKLVKIILDSRGRRPIRACYLTVALSTVAIEIGRIHIHWDRILVTRMGISSRPAK